MRYVPVLIVALMLIGCGAFTNPDGTPMTRAEINQKIHDDLVASSEAAHVVGAAGVPYAELIATGLGLLSTVFVAKSSGDRHAAVLKHALAQGSIKAAETPKVG